MIYLDFQYNTHTLPNTKSVECESVKISQKICGYAYDHKI